MARLSEKQKALCDWVANGTSDDCEDCRRKLLKNEHVYWIADGYPSSDGTYMCSECATRFFSDGTATATSPQDKA